MRTYLRMETKTIFLITNTELLELTIRGVVSIERSLAMQSPAQRLILNQQFTDDFRLTAIQLLQFLERAILHRTVRVDAILLMARLVPAEFWSSQHRSPSFHVYLHERQNVFPP